MSPYKDKQISEWKKITELLVKNHPLDTNEIVSVVFEAWDGIMKTKIADRLQIGIDIFPSPQILGNYLHELIPVLLNEKHNGVWTKDLEKKDKDLVYVPNSNFSVEIKTSSNPNNLYGNRSYGQESTENTSGKSKSGYYLGINFEKFDSNDPSFKPSILKIRFGWLDHDDWKAQKAATGQQATLSKEARDNKMIVIYSK